MVMIVFTFTPRWMASALVDRTLKSTLHGVQELILTSTTGQIFNVIGINTQKASTTVMILAL